MNQDFYLLIAGSREYNDYQELSKICDFLLAHQIRAGRRIVVVSGGARGADALAERYAVERRFDRQIFHADWKKYGKSAGFRRNEQMHNFITQFDNRACVCFWDGKSKGTQHNFSLCEKKNTPLRIWNYVTKTYVVPKV